jgi:hypothetical protein
MLILFKAIPKPVCGAGFDDLDGNAHICRRTAPYWTPWHIHVGDQVWFFSVQTWLLRTVIISRMFYFPLKGRRTGTR